MSLTKFDDANALLRARLKLLKLIEADVYIAKGNLDGETLPTMLTLATFIANMECLGVNAKDSPAFENEDVVEEVDYEEEVIGVTATGVITVKRINQAINEWISDDLRNEEVTVLIIPKGTVATDVCMFIAGIKLKTKSSGKANAEDSPIIEFSYKRKVDKLTDIYTIHEIEAGTP